MCTRNATNNTPGPRLLIFEMIDAIFELRRWISCDLNFAMKLNSERATIMVSHCPYLSLWKTLGVRGYLEHSCETDIYNGLGASLRELEKGHFVLEIRKKIPIDTYLIRLVVLKELWGIFPIRKVMGWNRGVGRKFELFRRFDRYSINFPRPATAPVS